MTKPLPFLLALLLAVLLTGCAEPLPPERADYAGVWRNERTRLSISPDGRVLYTTGNGNMHKKIDAPIKRFDGDSFAVGVGPFATTFVVSAAPRRGDDGRWRMTVDGAELVRE
ncbi:hypothetical protein [Tahibacter caeni]|uniref:hypothetical protein n=1 Tax=Tahibacter caeni TaxID=1453545 RepID=UPI0021485DFA|nr:hypothetical protein [Tahibacter caeni]